MTIDNDEAIHKTHLQTINDDVIVADGLNNIKILLFLHWWWVVVDGEVKGHKLCKY